MRSRSIPANAASRSRSPSTRTPKPRAECACETVRVSASAPPIEVRAGHLVRGLGLGMIHPLRDCPGAMILPQRARAFICGALIERRDLQPFECRRDKGFKRPAVEHAFDESSPLRLAGGRELHPWSRCGLLHGSCRSMCSSIHADKPGSSSDPSASARIV